MVYRKKNYRKRGIRKTRARKYKRNLRRVPNVARKVYYFKRSFETTSLTIPAANAAFTPTVFGWSLGNLPNYSEFQQIFDMYKIKAIKVTFIPDVNLNNVATNKRINFYTVLDFNDVGALTSVPEACEYANVHRTTSTKTHKRYFKPACAVKLSDVNSNQFTRADRPGWVSTGNTNIAYGYLKWIADLNPNANDITFKVYTTMYIAFKNVR